MKESLTVRGIITNAKVKSAFEKGSRKRTIIFQMEAPEASLLVNGPGKTMKLLTDIVGKEIEVQIELASDQLPLHETT